MTEPLALPIVVPELGNGDLAIRLGCWLVDVGDEIIPGDRLAELILPGTVFELTATASGRLTRIERANGAAVECGTVLAMFTPEIQETDDDS